MKHRRRGKGEGSDDGRSWRQEMNGKTCVVTDVRKPHDCEYCSIGTRSVLYCARNEGFGV